MKITEFPMQKFKRTQQGVVLIVGLVMVLLISIVALAAIRGSGLQEIMAGNIRERTLAFQASEAALVVGENQVNFRRGTAPICDNTVQTAVKCFSNLDLTPSGLIGSAQYFDSTKFATNGNLTDMSLTTLSGVSSEPIYVLEELATFTPDDGSGMDESAVSNLIKLTSYRVTSRGVGATSNSDVIVQSTYNRSAH